jgi:hypothetical protein
VRVTIEKLPGVDSATVSLNEGRAIIRLLPGNTLTMAQILRSVTRNGFTPRQATITAAADVTMTHDTVRLRISGTSDVFVLAGSWRAPGPPQQLKERVGQRVLVDGRVPAPQRPPAVPLIEVDRVEPLER